MPSPVQITAEKLLQEAKIRELELVSQPPEQKISDPEELADYQMQKRMAFEDNIHKNRSVMTNWIKYAQWEESQKELQRVPTLADVQKTRFSEVTLKLNYSFFDRSRMLHETFLEFIAQHG